MIGVQIPARSDNFLTFEIGSGPSQIYHSPFPDVKQAKREADHSRPDEGCMEIYLHSPIHLHDVDFVYAQGNFAITLTT
jgi:hypothetical protein